jgi:hypothetical protein
VFLLKVRDGMSSTSAQPTTPGAGVPHARLPELWHGVLIGCIPLGVLAALAAVAVGLTAGARALTTGQSFATEQLATVLTLALGLALGFVLYGIAIVLIWRQMTAWRLAGAVRKASGALWAMAITALIVLLPVVLALVIPQHPAP